jgi:ADP-heptose:LPS heptosyltransferase
MEPFLASLSKKNTYVNFVYPTWIDLAKLLAFSRGVITFNGAAASLSAYVGAKTLALYDSEDPQKYGPFYFLSDVMILGTNDPNLVNSSVSGGSIQGRKQFQMGEVFSKAYDFFKLKVTQLL